MMRTALSRARSSLSLGEFAILGLLREQPLHGYEVARRFAADLDLGLVLPLDISNVYAMLKDLHEQGLLEGRRETVGRRPPRTVFHTTPDAETVFLEWLEEPVGRMREVRADLLVKLYFCRAISAQSTARLLDAQVGACRAYLARMTALVNGAEPESFERLVRHSKLSAARATLDWLEWERTRLAG